jgi:hypothetical protein
MLLGEATKDAQFEIYKVYATQSGIAGGGAIIRVASSSAAARG